MFDWGQYYVLARDLLLLAGNSQQKEAILRSAVSRAYYAAFHAADGYLQRTGKYPPMQENSAVGSHDRIINTFIRGTTHPDWVRIGRKLKKLKGFRHWADYNPLGTAFLNTDDVADKVEEAEEIIKLLKSL